jgi:hypothetical protein
VFKLLEAQRQNLAFGLGFVRDAPTQVNLARTT